MKKTFLTMFLFSATTIINAQLPTLAWAKNMSESYNSQPNSITTDASGNVYTTGAFCHTADFDPGIGTFNLIASGWSKTFVSKLDAFGNFVWAKDIGGDSSLCVANSIIIDAAGNVIVTGFFKGTVDFDPGTGVYDLTSDDNYSLFIFELDASGNFNWVKVVGGTDDIISNAIALDTAGNIFTTGYFSGTIDFDPGVGVVDLTSMGENDIFISKLDNVGNFIWTKSLQGSLDDKASSIAIDAANNIYTTGYFEGTVDFDPNSGVYNLSADSRNAFVSKLNASGNFVWAKNIGGIGDTNSVVATCITLGASADIYLTGGFSNTIDFDPGAGVVNLIASGAEDLFISKLDSAGNYIWASRTGGVGGPEGSNVTQGQSIVVDASDNVYSTGYFSRTADFDPGPDTFNLVAGTTFSGLAVGYISKLDAEGNFAWARSINGTFTISTAGNDIAIDGSYIYVIGELSGTADFNPGIDSLNLTGVDWDIFILKWGEGALNINQYDDKTNAIIYPNPATDQLTIAFDATEINTSVEIKNMLGQTLYSEILKNGTGNQSTTIDVSAFARGVYFIQLKNQHATGSKKFVKE